MGRTEKTGKTVLSAKSAVAKKNPDAVSSPVKKLPEVKAKVKKQAVAAAATDAGASGKAARRFRGPSEIVASKSAYCNCMSHVATSVDTRASAMDTRLTLEDISTDFLNEIAYISGTFTGVKTISRKVIDGALLVMCIKRHGNLDALPKVIAAANQAVDRVKASKNVATE